jgi:hypothetical protein
MDSIELDKIYVFLSAALGHNPNPNKKYYFDRSDKVFFNLKKENYVLKIWEKEGSPLSESAKNLLNIKIQKINAKSPDIFEIDFLDKTFELFPVPKNEESEEFKKRMEIWKKLFEEVDTFLNLKRINVEETRLIE